MSKQTVKDLQLVRLMLNDGGVTCDQWVGDGGCHCTVGAVRDVVYGVPGWSPNASLLELSPEQRARYWAVINALWCAIPEKYGPLTETPHDQETACLQFNDHQFRLQSDEGATGAVLEWVNRAIENARP